MVFEQEIEAFCAQYGAPTAVDVLIADMNGIFRGKKLPAGGLEKVAAAKVYFPYTTPFLTTNGANAEQTLDAFGSDPDRGCRAVPGTLKPVPWAKVPTAQILLEMVEEDGQPHFADPRHILNSVLTRLKELGLRPVVALEYEFFLFKMGVVPPVPAPPPNGLPAAYDANCYNLDVFADYEPLLDEIAEAADMQGIDVSGLVCEYGNGQFEVNLNHHPDALKACDDALLLKRIIKAVAHKHGLLASFMAKPLADEVGSGLHAHVSLINEGGENIFSHDEEKLGHAVAGMLETMPAATAFFAPNANSYRRFDAEWFAPVVRSWGENNRRLALRLPLADRKNRRFEHRVSGADASPHLVLAAILAGAHHGLVNRLVPPQPLGEFDNVDFRDVLPPRWKMALATLRDDKVIADYFGDSFVDLYLQVRESEEEEFHRRIGPADHEQYLRIL